MRRACSILTLLFFALLVLSGCRGGEAPPPPTAEKEAAVFTPPARVAQPGRWRPVRERAVAESTRKEMKRLEAIGYVSGSREAGDRSGVVLHRRDLAGTGFNLYLSGHGPEAILMDMDGVMLHRWHYSCDRIWPDPDKPYNLGKNKGKTRSGKSKKMDDPGSDVNFFRNAFLLPDGDLLAIFEGRGLIRLDRDSNLVWASRCGAHHDLDLRENGDILVLTREVTINPLVSEDQPILEDFITTIDPADGSVKQKVSLLSCFSRAPEYQEIWRSSENPTGDIFHTNTLFLLRDPPRGVPSVFTAGRVLTAMRTLHCVALVDLEQEQVVWAGTGRFRAIHDPRLLKNGNLLLFDNLGNPTRSRVLEFDLKTWRPSWSYVGTTEQPFFSETCGTAQRLGNGNTLVTESDGGRAFETTPEGEIVWEFWNPHRAGKREQLIAALFTIRRLAPGTPLYWAAAGPP